MSAELILRALGFTLTATCVSFVLAALLGALVAAARRGPWAPLRWLAIAWVSVLRGVPPLVWLFVAFFGINLGQAKLTALTATILTFSLVGSAFLAEAYRSGLDSVSRTQFEAVSATAMPAWPGFSRVILPQALPVSLSAAGAYLIHLLKDTALASLIGVQELTFITNDAVQRGSNGFTAFLLLGLAYLALSVPVALAARTAEAKLRKRWAVAA
ncbi:MAG: ABC transporter permease subunit [Arthrobacter sp.]|nr:ABC transporter permease subunit [Arthrobacter sp.]